MAFFDDLGKMITQTGQDAVNKTKEVAEVAKLNSNISSAKNRIDDLYRQIGQTFAERNADTTEEPYAGLLAQIVEQKRMIADMQQEIGALKGFRSCPGCGAKVADGVAFCGRCGAQMPR